MNEREQTVEIKEKRIKSLDLTMTPGELKELRDQGELKGKRVVIVDVLRATSTIIAALQNGASEIIPVSTIEEAQKLKKELGEDALLGGEREGKLLPGFDFGNSPREYTKERVEGKIVILTTSHGAQTIAAAQGAQEIIIASAINAAAVSRYLQNEGGDIILAASGSIYTRDTGEKYEHRGGKEDVITGCGLVLQGLLKHHPELKKPWLQRLEKVSQQFGSPEKVEQALLESRWGQKMLELDKMENTNYRQEDIKWIAGQTNKIPIVPIVEQDGKIRIKEQYD